MCDSIAERRLKSRVSDQWLEVFEADPQRALWPEVRSMARELIQARAELNRLCKTVPPTTTA